MEKWVGKVAVVTGASAGIGAAIFKDIAKQKIIVIGLARRSERVEGLIAELGKDASHAFAFKCDVSDSEQVDAAFKWIESKFGSVDILVNNAGFSRNTTFLGEGEDSFQKMEEVLNTNVLGLTRCTRAAYRLMKKNDDYGIIININSIAGHYVPIISFSMNMYAASKHAVTALTETIRQELVVAGNMKVRVTASILMDKLKNICEHFLIFQSLSPGNVTTEIKLAAGRDLNSIAPMPALKAEDVSHSVMFLLSTPYNVNISELTIRPVGERE